GGGPLEGPIRLVGSGSTRCSGRVEIYHNNIWGTVFDFNWDLNDAEVVCRQLNCGPALQAPRFSYFGAGTGQIWLYNVACSGSESSLTECQNSGWGTYIYGHGNDAGVICSGPVRLTGSGSTRCSGRVEVYYNNIWGTVCVDGWDLNDAAVVCRELNCGTAVKTPQSAQFGPGTGQIWLDNVTCSGNESSLTECKHSGFGIKKCERGQSATVICSGVPILLAGSGSTRCSGRVEVYHNNSWGTVCDDGWDLNDAEVVCRELNCGSALQAPQLAYFGEGTGQIWLDDVVCSGSESSLTQCQHSGFGSHNCVHGEDAGVICSGEKTFLVLYVPIFSVFWGEFSGVPIRLGGSGSTRCSGRVEVYHNNIWGTVCDDGWDLNDAEVVCRELNCGSALQAPRSAYFGAGTGQIWLDDVVCSGSESSLTQCQHSGFGSHNCVHGEDAGVICSGEKTLAGPESTQCSGRVEVYHNNIWGTVCDDGWDLNDAEVVCRELKCGPALLAPQNAYFGQGTGQIWLDEVTCSGNENFLTGCQFSGFGAHNCKHSADADIILAGSGSTRCSGRVEVYHNNTWGTVCDDGWDLKDAQVVCRQLNCGPALEAPRMAYFGAGSGQIWLDNVTCSGNESSLAQCSNSGFGVHRCNHSEDAGVICSATRLAGSGSTRCSGRVEIYHNNIWGTVCGDGWDLNDAEVVCRELNCGPALEAPRMAYFGAGSGQIWLDNVTCSGNESSLTECQHSGWGTNNCAHDQDAGVICSGFPIRLVGSGLTTCSGRVEIYHNNIWGTVCGNSWDLNDAQVVCRQFNCWTALEAPQNAHFGAGTGEIWLDEVACSGNESFLTECQRSGFGVHDCDHSKDASVICSGEIYIFFGHPQDDTSSVDIRLAGSGLTQCSGRVEIYHNNIWGTVCDDRWDLNAAEVVCRQLNCGPALEAPQNAFFGEGTGEIWLDDVICSGSEDFLTDCPNSGFGNHDCDHSEDASVICSAGSGLTQCSGRVEIYHNNLWGTICGDGWDLNDAEVVCRQLNCGPALGAPQMAYFGAGSGQIWLDNVGCSGSESSLTECQNSGWGTNTCAHDQDAGVICTGEKLLDAFSYIRLISRSGLTQCSGRVEIYHNNIWGTICGDGWDLNDAEVCRQLNCGPALGAPQMAYFGAGSGQIWLDNVGCSGSESSLTECQNSGWGTNTCAHDQDAGVICTGEKLLDAEDILGHYVFVSHARVICRTTL
uniref:SRCR domain-containing protein n=1 Tax=Maylandia zebra TaxID=106582 RepID=A0A3P9D2W4_9CICH